MSSTKLVLSSVSQSQSQEIISRLIDNTEIIIAMKEQLSPHLKHLQRDEDKMSRLIENLLGCIKNNFSRSTSSDRKKRGGGGEALFELLLGVLLAIFVLGFMHWFMESIYWFMDSQSQSRKLNESRTIYQQIPDQQSIQPIPKRRQIQGQQPIQSRLERRQLIQSETERKQLAKVFEYIENAEKKKAEIDEFNRKNGWILAKVKNMFGIEKFFARREYELYGYGRQVEYWPKFKKNGGSKTKLRKRITKRRRSTKRMKGGGELDDLFSIISNNLGPLNIIDFLQKIETCAQSQEQSDEDITSGSSTDVTHFISGENENYNVFILYFIQITQEFLSIVE
jgi:hypothetical protein